MAGDRVSLFDTSLRDGGQTRGVDCTVADKQGIARTLDEIGADYIEAVGPAPIPPMTCFSPPRRPLRGPNWWPLA